MSRLTAAQDGALLELSRKLDDKGEARPPKWRQWKTIRALIDQGFIEGGPPAFPQRFRITAAGKRQLDRRAKKSL